MAASKESVKAAPLKVLSTLSKIPKLTGIVPQMRPHDQQGWSFLSVVGFAAMAVIASSYLQHPENRWQLSEYQTAALTYVSPLFDRLFSITLPEQPISTVILTRVETVQVLQTPSADPMKTPAVQVTEVTPAVQVTVVTPAVQVTDPTPAVQVTEEYEFESPGACMRSDHDGKSCGRVVGTFL